MVEVPPVSKQDEQHPLLSGEGAGDGGRNPPSVTMVAPGWGSDSGKQTWRDRWPEFLSACWMTFILLGISFLVFYLIGVSAYKRQAVIVVKDMPSKPASNVFFHQIIPRGKNFPFAIFSDFLSSLAQQYPLLRFNIYLLKDDSRHNILEKLDLSYNPPEEFKYRLEEENKRMMRDFQLRFQNVNITVIRLSNYMSSTPLKYKWRTIPQFHLPFYARVCAVWQHGGIGLDMVTFYEQYMNNKHIDKRINAILKQHNDGINKEDYGHLLHTIDNDEDDMTLDNIFMFLLNSMLNHGQSLLNYSPPFSNVTNEKLIRTHRSKREVIDPNTTKNATELSSDVENVTAKNILNPEKSNEINDVNSTKGDESSTVKYLGHNFTASTTVDNTNNSKTKPNASNFMMYYYDFYIYSHGNGPSYVAKPKTGLSKKNIQKRTTRRINHVEFLTMDREGMFIASTTRFHPFLGHLFNVFDKKVHPRCALNDAYTAQCSGIFMRDDIYCKNIFFL